MQLIEEENYNKASKYLDKLKKNKKNQFDYRNYLQSKGVKIYLFKEYNLKKRKYLSNIIKELDDYLIQYGFDQFILLQKIQSISSLINANLLDDSISKEQKISNVFEIIENYKIRKIYDEIPKNKRTILLEYVNLLSTTSSGLFGIKDKANEYEILNYNERLSFSTQSVHIILRDILFSNQFHITYTDKENIIKENKSNLEEFLWLASEYQNQAHLKVIEFDNRLYSGTFQTALEVAQILSQNDVKKSVSKILLKHKIQNKKNKNLIDEKFNLESILKKQSEEISEENTEKTTDQLLLNKFISNKKELEKINNEIINSNPEIFDDYIYPKKIDIIFENLDKNEGIIYFYKGRSDYYVFLIGDYFGNLIRFSNNEKNRITNDVIEFINYSKNINNYYNTNFPYKSAHWIYETFFDWYWSKRVLNKVDHFSIIGDGIFTTFPFWLLLTEEIEYYNEKQLSSYPWFSKKFSYSLYTSINDILFKKKNDSKKINLSKNKVDKLNSSNEFDFVGIGNPILDKSKSADANETVKILFKGNNKNDINLDGLKYFPALPETENELKEIQSNFDAKKTKLLLRESAIEENVKNTNLTNSKFIVFATHALFSGELNDLTEPGIVLTPTIDNKDGNEGLLLASEISNLNLINTELVVLSACNTSFSLDASSVPLSGLAKSFFLAGAKSIIVTGWSVETNSSAYLSSNIFKKAINQNMRFSKALQLTINEMIEKNMHPLMWGPFILVGESR